MQASGGHHHGPHHYSNGVMNANRWSHHANPSIPQPDGHWTGGAGGAGGAAAPAQTGATGQTGTPGKRGGGGGGGGILVICDTITTQTIVYNTSGGLLASDDVHSASVGAVYLLINS